MAASTISWTSLRIPDDNGARRVNIPDSSTSPVKHQGWAYSAADDEAMDLDGECLEGFDGTKDIEIIIPWIAVADTDTAHDVVWKVYFLKIVKGASGTDIGALDVSTDYTIVSKSSTLVVAGDKMTTVTITILSASHACVAGDTFHIRIERDRSEDDIVGDAYLMEGHLIIREAS